MGNEETVWIARYSQMGCAAPSSAPIGHELPAEELLADFPTQLVELLALVALVDKRAALTIPPKPFWPALVAGHASRGELASSPPGALPRA